MGEVTERNAFSSDTAVYPGELLGYRYWDLMTDGVLQSLSFYQDWETCLEATCGDGHHPAPNEGCGCGIYAWYTPGDAGAGTCHEWVVNQSSYVFGVIAASGKIVPGTKGFRAERARILGLFEKPDATCGYDFEPVDWDHYKARYPDVKFASSVEELTSWFPPQDVPWAR